MILLTLQNVNKSFAMNEVLKDVTGDPAYKNRALAETQRL